jgi:hypothetical protein
MYFSIWETAFAFLAGPDYRLIIPHVFKPITLYGVFGISRGSTRIWECERADARSHSQIRGFTTAIPGEQLYVNEHGQSLLTLHSIRDTLSVWLACVEISLHLYGAILVYFFPWSLYEEKF